jgi:hypothetical protein
MLPDFIGNLLVPQISVNTQAGGFQRGLHFFHVGSLRIRNIQDRNLHRRQPQRQRAGIVLDQDADEALHRADDRAVQHHRHLAGVVFRNIFGAQAARHREVDLHGADLPRTAEAVLQVVLDLRAVEGALARQLGPLHAAAAQGRTQRFLGLVPDFVGADAVFRTQRDLDVDVRKPKSSYTFIAWAWKATTSAGDLLFGAEHVAVVLGKAAHAHQAVQRARGSLRWHWPNSP